MIFNFDLILGVFFCLVIGYLVLDYFILKKGYDLTRRLKYLVISIFSLLFGAFLLWVFIDNISDSIDLAGNGIEVVAVVKESKVERKIQRKRLRIYYVNTIDIRWS